jgi:hypothetical protein
MKAVLRRFSNADGEFLGTALMVWCPGCNARKGWGGLHQVGVSIDGGPAYGETWTWDGNLEAPTLSPSIAVSSGDPLQVMCHSYIEAGCWRYLDDCQHPLAGQTVDLPDLPQWVLDEAVDV